VEVGRLARQYEVPRPDDAAAEADAVFTAIFDEYFGRIHRYLIAVVHDSQLAEDLAQETFVKVYQTLRMSPAASASAPPVVRNLNAWLYTIATNTAFSALRRRRLFGWLPLYASSEVERKTTDHPLEEVVGDRGLLRQALAQLPRSDVSCLLLRFQEGLSYEEMAAVFGSSVPAMKMRLSRARAAFREIYLRLSQEANA